MSHTNCLNAGIPSQVELPVPTELHNTINNLSRELQCQLRKQGYNFKTADAVIKEVGGRNSRAVKPSRKQAAKSGNAMAARSHDHAAAAPADHAMVSRKVLEPAQQNPNGLESSGLAPDQAPPGSQQEAAELKPSIHDKAVSSLHPATHDDAVPEPVARVQKHPAPIQAAESGTAAASHADEPLAKRTRVGPQSSHGASGLLGENCMLLAAADTDPLLIWFWWFRCILH